MMGTCLSIDVFFKWMRELVMVVPKNAFSVLGALVPVVTNILSTQKVKRFFFQICPTLSLTYRLIPLHG